MGIQDRMHSDYFDSKERFADVFNGCLFEGSQIIRPQELTEADSVFTLTGKGEAPGTVICDKVKKWKGVYFSILILENQTYIDYYMVFRAMRDELSAYDRQRKQAYNKALAEGVKFDSDEYLSKMLRNQTFQPVITLVLYLGTDKPWDGKTQLHDLLAIQDELKPFVSNYRLNLYDYHNQNDFTKFKTENRLLFELLSASDNKDKMRNIIKRKSSRYSKDKEVVKAVLGCMNVKVDIEDIFDKKKGAYDMCKAIKDLIDEGRMEGIVEGRQEGILEGRKEGIVEGRKEGQDGELMLNVKNLMSKLNLSLEQTLELLDVSEERRQLFFHKSNS